MTYYPDKYESRSGKLKDKPHRDGCVPSYIKKGNPVEVDYIDDKDGGNLEELIKIREIAPPAKTVPNLENLSGAAVAYPVSQTWRNDAYVGKVWNQGNTNSCVGHALAACMFDTRRRYGQVNPVSRQFIYWAAREAQGISNQDIGCNIGVAWTELKNKGACLGNNNDFLGSGFNYQAEIMTRPSAAKFAEAATRKLVNGVYWNSDYNGSSQLINYYNESGAHQSVRSDYIRHLLQYLPVTIGFRLLSSHYTAPGGVLQVPTVGQASPGGHAVVITGYNDASRLFEFKNSWGTGWGSQGYGYMPYSFVDTPSLTYDVTYGYTMTA